MAIKQPHYEYQFEIETILHQFLAIIDNALVMRYDKNHETGERTLVNTIKPQYVFGLKSRILYSLVNKAQNYTLPLIGISIRSIKADKERLQDKQNIISRFYNGTLEGMRRPTPISIGVNLTIVAKYMTDMYQMFGKFATQFQPYCVYSWAVPSDDNFSYEELRNKIEWDMNLNIEQHDKLTETDEDRYAGTMSFEIQGWLFSNAKSCVEGIILDIGTSVIAESDVDARILTPEGEPASMSPFRPLVDQYVKEYKRGYGNPREYANAHPRITHCFIRQRRGGADFNFSLNERNRKTLSKTNGNLLVLKGYNMENANALFIPVGGGVQPAGEELKLDYRESELFPKEGTTEKKPHILRGYALKVVEKSANTMVIDLKDMDYTGEFDLAVYDNVDYQRLSEVYSNPLSVS